MENLKNYDDFVNEEINWELLKVIGISGLILAASPLFLVMLLMLYPVGYGKRFYLKYFKKDWGTFARGIQISMDLMWVYSIKITEMERQGIDDLDSKQLKMYNKIKKLLIKNFGKIEITKNEVKDYAKSMFDKVSKEKDRELIYKMIDDYQVREYQLDDNKKIKKLKDIIDVLGIRNNNLNLNRNPEEIAPFEEEEDWEDEEDPDTYVGETFYFMNFSKFDKDAGDRQGYLGKATLEEYMRFRNNKFKLGGLIIDKKMFFHTLNKYFKQPNIVGNYIHLKLNSITERHGLVIIPEDNKYLFEQIVKDNLKWIKYQFKVYSKNVSANTVFRQYTDRISGMMNEMQSKDIVKMLDDGFDFTGGNVDFMNYSDHPGLLGDVPRARNNFRDRMNIVRDEDW